MKARTMGAALATLAVLLNAAAALGQSKTGTTMGQFLLIEPSARIAGMGNAGAALLAGIDAAYYNPAALGRNEGLAVLFAHNTWFADITYDYAAAAMPVGGWGSVFATVTALGSGEMDVRTVTQPLGTGERFRVSDLAIGLGVARLVTDRFSAGLQVSYVQETIWNSTANTLTLNLGTLYEVSEEGLRIGASLANFGTQGRFDGRDLGFLYDQDSDVFGDNSALPGERATDDFPVPVVFRVGLGMPYAIPQVGRFEFAVDAFHPNDNTESISLGAEFAYRELVSVRCGYQNLFLEDSEVGLTAGGGARGEIDTHAYRVDYAWANHGRLGSTHRVAFSLEF